MSTGSESVRFEELPGRRWSVQDGGAGRVTQGALRDESPPPLSEICGMQLFDVGFEAWRPGEWRVEGGGWCMGWSPGVDWSSSYSYHSLSLS